LAEEPRLTDEDLAYAKMLADIVWREWELKRVTPKIIKPQLERVALYFVRECKKRGLDPQEVDFRHEIAEAGLSERELREKVDEVLTMRAGKPPEALEVAPEEAYRVIEALGKKVVELKDYELIEKAQELKRQLERERRNAKLLREQLEAKKRYIEELERSLAGLPTPAAAPPAPPKPPEVKPPPAPPAKVLPEVPEKCAIDGSPISEVTRVPIGPVPVRLTPEEEYLRARLGLPVPERELVWLDVPPTIKIYHCQEDHLFERDPATGRLVQRTPEYVYRKILRETATLRRIAYPTAPAPALPSPAPAFYYYPPPPPRPMRLQDVWWSFVENVKGISREKFMTLSEEEKARIRREFVEWMRGGFVF
jgi:hypothetical protein